jgi:sulfate permease, SulP family
MIARFRSVLATVRPDRRTLKSDAIAGVPGAIGSVPDGMACAVLAGVNPIHGLYAGFAGPIAGGTTASTRLMVITTTGASALAAGSAIQSLDSADRSAALFVIVAVAGALMIAAGLLRLGRYTRFVSVSVMIGFLTGVAANIVLGQLPDLAGAEAEGSTSLAKAIDLITHPGRIEVASLAVGLGAIAIFALLARTRISPFAPVAALAIPTLLTLGVASILRVDDVGDIPQGVPVPHLPDFDLLFSVSVMTGALSIAAIVLVQGAGVSEAAPNPGGSMSDPNRDFIAQGAGNVASGLFRGIPVGGSVGQTALNVASGARSRWASIFAGIWMLAILVAFSGIVGRVAMPTLAAVLIYAAIGSIRVGGIETVFRTGRTSQIAIVTTFLATLFLSIPQAVGIGVALSLLLQLNKEALDLAVVELVPRLDGRFDERPAPARLRSRDVTLIDVYGSLYYAGSRTLQVKLPDPAGAESPVVVLRLRGRTALGATAFVVLAAYADRLQELGGRLFLSGVDPGLFRQLQRARRVDVEGRVHVFEATRVVGESSAEAYRQAQAWLDERDRVT